MVKTLKNSIREKSVYLYNAAPEITRGEFEDTVLESPKPVSEQKRLEPLFRVRVEWAPGDPEEQESFFLDPGEFAADMKGSVARMLARDLQVRGVVVVENPEDDEEVRRATFKALKTMKENLNERGRKQLLQYQKKGGFTEAEMEIEKDLLHPYYVNAEKEKLVDAEIAKLRKSGTKSSTRTASAN